MEYSHQSNIPSTDMTNTSMPTLTSISTSTSVTVPVEPLVMSLSITTSSPPSASSTLVPPMTPSSVIESDLGSPPSSPQRSSISAHSPREVDVSIDADLDTYQTSAGVGVTLPGFSVDLPIRGATPTQLSATAFAQSLPSLDTSTPTPPSAPSSASNQLLFAYQNPIPSASSPIATTNITARYRRPAERPRSYSYGSPRSTRSDTSDGYASGGTSTYRGLHSVAINGRKATPTKNHVRPTSADRDRTIDKSASASASASASQLMQIPHMLVPESTILPHSYADSRPHSAALSPSSLAFPPRPHSHYLLQTDPTFNPAVDVYSSYNSPPPTSHYNHQTSHTYTPHEYLSVHEPTSPIRPHSATGFTSRTSPTPIIRPASASPSAASSLSHSLSPSASVSAVTASRRATESDRAMVAARLARLRNQASRQAAKIDMTYHKLDKITKIRTQMEEEAERRKKMQQEQSQEKERRVAEQRTQNQIRKMQFHAYKRELERSKRERVQQCRAQREHEQAIRQAERESELNRHIELKHEIQTTHQQFRERQQRQRESEQQRHHEQKMLRVLIEDQRRAAAATEVARLQAEEAALLAEVRASSQQHQDMVEQLAQVMERSASIKTHAKSSSR